MNKKHIDILPAWISLISNIALSFLKVIIGLIFKSQVLIADGFHNGGDVIASIVSLTSANISKKPADDDHPYGHGKAEVIAAVFVSVILGIASIYICVDSFLSLFSKPNKAHLIVLIVAIISIIWKQILYIYCIKIGKDANSKGLIATAYDHLADVYSSIAATIGITFSFIGDLYNIPIMKYGDPVSGIVVSVFIFKLAFEIGKESIDILMERNVSNDILSEYISIIHSFAEVKRIDKIRAREHGHYIIIDIRIGIDGTLTVQEGHDISKKIRNKILDEHLEVEEVLIHLNPWYDV